MHAVVCFLVNVYMCVLLCEPSISRFDGVTVKQSSTLGRKVDAFIGTAKTWTAIATIKSLGDTVCALCVCTWACVRSCRVFECECVDHAAPR